MGKPAPNVSAKPNVSKKAATNAAVKAVTRDCDDLDDLNVNLSDDDDL
jgi:hypothetical protein